MPGSSEPTPPAAIPSPAETRRLHLLSGLALLLILLPQLLFSSPEYRQWPRFAAFTLVAFVAGPRFVRTILPLAPVAIVFVAALLVVHAASWWGGWKNGDSAWTATRLASEGLLGVSGFAILIHLLADRRRPFFPGPPALGLTVFLLCGSLIAYFMPPAWWMRHGASSIFFEPSRLSLFWPTRLLTENLGQIAWEHANHAGFLFAIALIAVFESLARRNHRLLWPLAIGLGAAVFLTGSRSAWLMTAAVLPLLLFRRPLPYLGKIALSLLCSILCGLACLKAKEALATPTGGGASTPAPPSRDLHVTGLVHRGSAGRLHGYRTLWNELKTSRAFGAGLSSTGRPVAHLNHEHSSYLATLRGGGLIALAAHFVLLGCALRAAFLLFAADCRPPLLLLTATLTGLLFDRSNVFIMSGRYDFLFHWAAVLAPLVLSAIRSRRPYHTRPDPTF